MSRNDKGQFEKGTSGNPGGRRSHVKDLERLIRAAIEREDGTNEAIEILLTNARTGEVRDSNAAVKLILAYGYGNPRQQVEVTGENGGPLEIAATRGLLASAVARLKK